MTVPEPADRVTLETLLAHRAWVRALARRLVPDAHRAEDVDHAVLPRAVSIWRRCERSCSTHARTSVATE